MPAPVKASLEFYESDRADFGRVLAAIGAIQSASLEQLRDLQWLVEVVRSVGIAALHPVEEIYADEAHLVNSSRQGLTQLPLEFAKFLRFMADFRIESYLEVGCYNGGTACLATAYLHRFNPQLRAVTIDLIPWFIFYPLVRELIPLEYRCGVTSFHFANERFDAVFIDGDHGFEWAWADYQNVGRTARVCGIHDVNSQFFYDQSDLGGVTAAWELIKRDEAGRGIEFAEFFEHPHANIFGIGVRARRA